jgi:hypothetical protein
LPQSQVPIPALYQARVGTWVNQQIIRKQTRLLHHMKEYMKRIWYINYFYTLYSLALTCIQLSLQDDVWCASSKVKFTIIGLLVRNTKFYFPVSSFVNLVISTVQEDITVVRVCVLIKKYPIYKKGTMDYNLLYRIDYKT